MFVSRYLLLFCFFTALCTNAAKNANLRDALASENTRLAAKHANTFRPARELASQAEPAGSPSGSPFITGLKYYPHCLKSSLLKTYPQVLRP
ncbi:hypothetical protein L596_001885 [Steinernema carpocapsae]|uniref:Uncharacterized protein n=1 Tax=Steinernema carpocapsae TaxID=34508 RepID=A0A4U8UQ86_STECR|nr:hypothetical protein L596_001885 [Steinernema carpocapsae]